ncbi:MAG: alpha/beta hydrolase [Labilithrix sp.]|nr:alpha/beta hydrolase [Labilithrix sp.]MBX3219967.1 alpha/beta hydrolase [Labilithrix sp.]
MSIASVKPSTPALLSALLVSSALLASCEKRSQPVTERTPIENVPHAPAPAAPPAAAPAPELRSAKMTGHEQTANVETKDALKAANADMRKVLGELDTLAKPIANLSVEDARKQPTLFDAQTALLKKEGKAPEPLPMAKIEDRKISGPGGQIPIRIYVPKVEGKGKVPPGVVVYYHGGGFALGDLNTYDASARAIAKGAEAIVIAPDYRRAPEHKFPAAHDDAFAAYEWVVKNAGSLGGDPKRVALAGEGAGGNLAANVALTARDKKDSGIQQPLHQLLIHPIAQTSLETRSYKEWANARPLDKATMGWFFDKLVRKPEDKRDPRLQLVDSSMKGVAPATIVLAEIDPLWSDGEMLYHAIHEGGVKAEKKTFEGVTHGFFGLGGSVADAKRAEDWATGRLKDALKP